MIGAIILSLFVAVLLESSITTIPLTLLVVFIAAVVIRKNEVFAYAFLAGLFLDLLTFRPIGISSLYFVTFVFVIFLYQRKFEIETLTFVSIFSFLGSWGYLFLEGTRFALAQSLFAAVVAAISFLAFKAFNKKARSTFSGQTPKYAS